MERFGTDHDLVSALSLHIPFNQRFATMNSLVINSYLRSLELDLIEAKTHLQTGLSSSLARPREAGGEHLRSCNLREIGSETSRVWERSDPIPLTTDKS